LKNLKIALPGTGLQFLKPSTGNRQPQTIYQHASRIMAIP
jgi:hypothetical protein